MTFTFWNGKSISFLFKGKERHASFLCILAKVNYKLDVLFYFMQSIVNGMLQYIFYLIIQFMYETNSPFYQRMPIIISFL